MKVKNKNEKTISIYIDDSSILMSIYIDVFSILMLTFIDDSSIVSYSYSWEFRTTDEFEKLASLIKIINIEWKQYVDISDYS